MTRVCSIVAILCALGGRRRRAQAYNEFIGSIGSGSNSDRSVILTADLYMKGGPTPLPEFVRRQPWERTVLLHVSGDGMMDLSLSCQCIGVGCVLIAAGTKLQVTQGVRMRETGNFWFLQGSASDIGWVDRRRRLEVAVYRQSWMPVARCDGL